MESESRKSKPKYTAYSQLKYTFFSSYGKIVLYPFIPGNILAYHCCRKSDTDTHVAGFAVQYTGKDAVTVFAVNFIAIFPTVMVLADAADELMLRTGDNLGALINATFRSDASRESVPRKRALRDELYSLILVMLCSSSHRSFSCATIK